MREGIFIGLGGNLGDRRALLLRARALIAERIGTVLQTAPFYETAAWGVANQPDYLNTVLEVRSAHPPEHLLRALLRIETELGRERLVRWGSRTVDLDLLFDNARVLETDQLTLPHPRLHERNFVLRPMCDLAPHFVHPVLGQTVQTLLHQSPDTLPVRPLPELLHSYLVIEGNIGAGKTTLSKMLADDFGSKLILEEFSDNPFLPHFYENPERYALTVELFFTTERHKQLRDHLAQTDLFQRGTVADYTFPKTQIFANVNLKDDELQLFQRLYRIMNASFPPPDLLVYLHRSPADLRRNIEQRGRPYEQLISVDYLEQVQRSYFDYFRSASATQPVLVIDAEKNSFWADPAGYERLRNLINRPYEVGMHWA